MSETTPTQTQTSHTYIMNECQYEFFFGGGLFPAPTVFQLLGAHSAVDVELADDENDGFYNETQGRHHLARSFSKPTQVGKYTNSDPNKPYIHHDLYLYDFLGGSCSHHTLSRTKNPPKNRVGWNLPKINFLS